MMQDRSPIHTVLYVALLSVLLPMQICLAGAEVLPPAAGERIGTAFDALPAPWIMDSASIEGGRVEATICEGEGGDCHVVSLSKPSPECSGTTLDAWCVEYGHGAPAEMQEAVESVFEGHELTDFWSAPTRDESSERSLTSITPAFVWAHVLVYLLALATLVVPLLLGLLLGWLWRWRRGRIGNRYALLVIWIVPVLPAVALPMEWLRIGVHDLLMMGWLAATSFTWAAHSVATTWSRKELALLAFGLLAGTVFAEAGTRLLAGPPPAFPPPDAASLLMPISGGFPHSGKNCDGLFPDLHPELVEERTRFPHRPVQVLHNGDSMLEGNESPQETRVIYLLNDVDEAVSHVDAGFSGTGIDLYYLSARRWLTAAPVDAVVWHVFLFNDVDDSMSHPYSCCGNLPPLEFGEDGFEVRCPEPVEGGFFGNRFVNSPAPYFLRVATHFSHFARHLCYVAGRQARKLMLEGVEIEEGWQRVRTVVQTMKAELDARGIPFTIVMVPYRGEWESFAAALEQQDEKRAFVQSLCQEFGIPCLDGREAFNDAIAQEGPAPFFVNEPVWDFHFSDRGHQLYADWLARVLLTPHRP
jgi:hypothetical protein